MLIDDDPTMLRLLKTLIEIEGFKTHLWGGGADVITELQAVQPDAVLLDVNLKGISGIDLLKKIRSDAAFSSVPVLMTSGMDYSEACRQAGATDFIMKPYMPDQLLSLIRSYFDRQA